MEINYVYAYLDPRKEGKYEYHFDKKILRTNFEPIYIGKGKNGRHKVHLDLNRCVNNFLRGKIQKIRKENKEPLVKFIKKGLSEEEAFGLEIKVIKAIGRIGLGGSLTNFTDGGEGIVNPSSKLIKFRRKNAIKLWKDPKYREKALKNRSKLRKKDWEDPEYRKQQSISRKKVWENNPERKKALSEWSSKARKEDWKDPEIRKRRSQGIKKSRKKLWENPEYVNRVFKSLEKARKIYIEKCKNGTIKRWKHSEETKKKMSGRNSGENNYFFGKHYKGEKNPRSKLTEKKVLKIRKLEEKGWSFFDLAEMHGVSESCICRAIEGNSWTYI